jgi:hypothetical protein
MSRWSKVVFLVLLLLVTAMALRNFAVTCNREVAGVGSPVPPTPWIVAGVGSPVPPTPWSTDLPATPAR